MKNLIKFIGLILLMINVSYVNAANNSLLPSPSLDTLSYKIPSNSIMFSNAASPSSIQNWQEGMNNHQKKIVKRNTLIYSIVGGVIGAGIPSGRQASSNVVASILFEHPVENYRFKAKPIIKGFLIGAVAGVGYTIGKRKAEGKGGRFKLIRPRRR